MKAVSITEAKNKLSALIDQVRGGETVLITDRGRPVARLESAAAASGPGEGRLSRLERAGLVRVATKAPSGSIAGTDPPRAGKGADALGALLEERRQGR